MCHGSLIHAALVISDIMFRVLLHSFVEVYCVQLTLYTQVYREAVFQANLALPVSAFLTLIYLFVVVVVCLFCLFVLVWFLELVSLCVHGYSGTCYVDQASPEIFLSLSPKCWD